MRADLGRKGAGLHLALGVAENAFSQNVGEAEIIAETGIVSYRETDGCDGSSPRRASPPQGGPIVTQPAVERQMSWASQAPDAIGVMYR
jgi:hypothetical protein